MILPLHYAPSEGMSVTCCRLWGKGAYLLVLQSSLEQSEKRSQTEAVHVVDFGQVGDDEEHLAGALGQGQVGVPLLWVRAWGGEQLSAGAPAT